MTYNTSPGEHDVRVLWSGKFLDGQLTIMGCAHCNKDRDPHVVRAVIQALDGTQWQNEYQVSPSSQSVNILMADIEKDYTICVMEEIQEVMEAKIARYQ